MNDFLKALKADLQNRQMLPFVALVAVGLLGAVGYALLGGGSTAATESASTPIAAPTSAGIVVSPANRETAVAETTNGAGEQRKGAARDPFKLLPGSEKKEAGSSTSTSSSSTSGSSSSSTTEKAGSSSPPVEESKAPAKPTKPAKPKTVYRVAALFGIVPAGTAPLSAQLTPYENLKLMTSLPSPQQPLVVFRGVTAGGKSASFTLVGEAILHGNGTCLPNPSQCQAIDLQKDHYEQLEYLTPTGETITYELRVVSIDSKKASAASLKSQLRGEKVGRELLRQAGLLEMPFLRQSTQTGVLVFAGHSGFAARAHGAGHRSH